jgi:hypothetical protein
MEDIDSLNGCSTETSSDAWSLESSDDESFDSQTESLLHEHSPESSRTDTGFTPVTGSSLSKSSKSIDDSVPTPVSTPVLAPVLPVAPRLCPLPDPLADPIGTSEELRPLELDRPCKKQKT